MSAKVEWRPSTEGRRLGGALKRVIAEEIWGHERTFYDWATVDSDFIPFLRGVIAAAEHKSDLLLEATKLCSLIEEYGSVEVRLAN